MNLQTIATPTDNNASRRLPLSLEQAPKFSGVRGKFFHLLGFTDKVWDGERERYFYYSKKGLVRLFVPHDTTKSHIIHRRILEAAQPRSDRRLTVQSLETVLSNFHATGRPLYAEQALSRLERLKESHPDTPHLFYRKTLTEIAPQLKPGDVLVRKYHEDNPNPICFLQKLFKGRGYREAHKCSHLALYLGEINGIPRIAEASMPHQNESQIRHIELNDPRFALAEKNQYMIFRHEDETIAREAAALAKSFAKKMHPEAESLNGMPKKRAYKYTYFEAVRSLWHSAKLNYFGKHRIFKYFADYQNGIAIHNLFLKRRFFCSHFVTFNLILAEVKNSKKFERIIARHPPPEATFKKYSGLKKVLLTVKYWIQRGVWSRVMTWRYGKELDTIVKTRLDFLRASPQDTVHAMFHEESPYSLVGILGQKSQM